MAFLFQKKLVCFYCGCKSAQIRTPTVRRWQCTNCEAENYLDENGEITDPPADDVSSSARYAESLARPNPSAFETPDDTLFCPTCLKNQHLVSQALAAYLPPPDAPDYAEYEKAEEEYLKGLEERYPQVCQRCEPKVQERIRAAGYAAKTDHLRRMMDRTRGHGTQYNDTKWGGLLVTLGGVGWFLSTAGQFLWDVLSLFESTEERHGLPYAQDPTSGSVCLKRVMRGAGSVSDCRELLYSAAGLALLLGISTFWWNPMLHATLRQRGVRAVGTMEFYRLQGMLLILKCATWWYLPSYDLDVYKIRAAHMSLLVLAAIMNIASFRSVRVDCSAPVKFQDSPAPLVLQTSQQKASGVGSGGFGRLPQRPGQPITRSDGGVRPFSITDLAPQNQRNPPVYHPPTPPPDENDSEAMDWTPSQETKVLRPSTLYRTLNAESQQPQPISYRGKLPAEALGQSSSLRNPTNQPVARRGTEMRNREHFKTPKKYAIRDSSDESPFVTPYEPSLASGSPDLSPVKFAQPRFFPHTDREDLGLESLMANNFSLAEEPHEVRARQRQGKREDETQFNLGHVYAQWHGLATLLLLALSYTLWSSTPIPSLAAFRMHLRLAAMGIAALVILKHLLPAINCKDHIRNVSDVILLALELGTTIILGATLRHRAATSPSEDSIGPLETPGTILIATLVVQEALMLYSGGWHRRTSNGDVASPPVLQSGAVLDEADCQQPFPENTMPSIRNDLNIGTGTGFNGQHIPVLSQRTTRSKMKLMNDTRAQSGSGSLYAGDEARNYQALGMNSLTLGQPQGRSRNGMW